MKKKSSRRPAPSRIHDDRIASVNMFDDEDDSNGSNPIAQHVVDTLINERNPHSIQDQNPNPNLNYCAPEEEKGGDLVQQSDDDDDVGPEMNNEEVDHAPRGGSRRSQKRRKLRKEKLRLEKKLKREATGNPSDDPDNPHPENVEKEGHLDESKVEGTSDNNPHPQNVEKSGDLELVGGVQEEQVEVKQQPKEPQDDQPVPQSVSRKTHKKKKMNARQKAAFEKKLNLVTENLNPIPFAPQRKLDFSIHEQLFKRLGLWEFVNMEFDQNIRSDLIALLVANYNPAGHCSSVNDVRIKLSRADLARALKLPVKKDKSISLETSDFDSEVLSEESISFINEFLSNWILLHDDTWILPNEVLNWDALIKKGQPHKVDWPQFIWYMVEKELKQASEIGTLYFASHIQCLIKSQREDLFIEKPPLEVPVPVPVDVEEDFDLEMGSLKDCDGLELQTELCLGQNASKEEYELEDAMDFEESKQETACQKQWFLDEKSYVMQRCSTSDVQNQQREHGIEEIEDEEYDDPQPKCSTMGGLASADIFQEIGTTSITYSPSFRNPGHSSGDPFHSEVDAHFNVGGMSLHVNSFKREVGHDDIEYHNTFSYHHNYKQMKSDVLPPDFNTYIEQIHHLANNAKEMYAEKEKACLNANMNEELVTDLQHRKDTLMDYLRKTRCELQRREMESYKLDGELQLMSNLLEGYRNDLKQNRLAFSKYRERNPEPEEPLYTDAGCGGIVLSTVELEKQRFVQEEEEKIKRCRIIKQALADFEAGCFENFEGCKDRVQQLDKRLFELVEKVKLYSVVVCSKKKMAETVMLHGNSITLFPM